jgi:hypothetical protein
MSDTTPTPRGGARPGQATDALRRTLAAQAPQRIAQDAIAVEALTTRPQLEALAQRLEEAHAALMLGERSLYRDAHEDIRRAADVVRAAAVHGYPRPALEQLGARAEGTPTARSADPATSHDAGASVSGTPTRRNHLGRMLVGFLVFERHVQLMQDAQNAHGSNVGAPYDHTLTSEELAHRVGLEHAEYAKRMSDLTALGYVRVALDDDGHERTRRGASGRQRLVFELTDDGRRLAAELGRSAG